MENLYETKQDNQDYLEELKALGVDADKMWRAYTIHRNGCRNRLDRNDDQVLFLMSFKDWSQMWLAKDAAGVSYWSNRGNQNASDYVISRLNDIGHYEVGNVVIQTNAENSLEANRWKSYDSDFCQTMSEAMKKAFEEADDAKKERMLRGAKAASKALSKPVSFNGTIYPSSRECARQVGVSDRTVSYQARNPNNPNIYYL
jgi:hypothetical protein